MIKKLYYTPVSPIGGEHPTGLLAELSDAKPKSIVHTS